MAATAADDHPNQADEHLRRAQEDAVRRAQQNGGKQ